MECPFFIRAQKDASVVDRIGLVNQKEAQRRMSLEFATPNS